MYHYEVNRNLNNSYLLIVDLPGERRLPRGDLIPGLRSGERKGDRNGDFKGGLNFGKAPVNVLQSCTTTKAIYTSDARELPY